MRTTLELRDLLDQIRELGRVELSLVRAEISESTRAIPSSLMAVVVGIVLLCLALGLVSVAASLFLQRFGLPLDLAFLIVAAVVIVVSLILLRVGRLRLEAVTTRAGEEHRADLVAVGGTLAWPRRSPN